MDKLNEATVKALPIPAKGNRLYYVDQAAKVQGAKVPRGLAIRVTAAGTRSFVLHYYHAGVERLRAAVRPRDDPRQLEGAGEGAHPH